MVAANPNVAEVLRAAASDFQAPLYFLLLHLWIQFGTSDLWLTLPSIFTGTATVALVYTAGKRLFSAPAGLVAALFAATTTYQIYYSRYPRSYMLLAFLAVLAAYALTRALDGERRWWVVHACAVIAALYTHLYVVFLLPVMWGYAGWVLLRGPDSRGRLSYMLTISAVALAFLPWVGITWRQWAGVQAGADAWIEPVTRDSLKTLWDWLWFKTRLDYGTLVNAGLSGARYLFTALMLLGFWRLRSSRTVWLVVGLTLGPLAPVFLFSVAVVPLWDPRYFVVLSPFFALWLGASVANAARGSWFEGLTMSGMTRSAAGSVIVLMAIPPLVSLYTDEAFGSPDLRAATAWVRERYRPGDLIVHTNYQSYLPALWYDHQSGTAASDGPFAAPCTWEALPRAWCSASPYPETYVNLQLDDFGSAMAGRKRLWLIGIFNHNHPGEKGQLDADIGRLGSGFSVAPLAFYTGVQVYQFERP